MPQVRENAEGFPWRVETGPLSGFFLSVKSFQAADDRPTDVLYVERRRLAKGGPQTDSKTEKKAHAQHIDAGNPSAHHLLSFLSLAQKGQSA